MNSWMHILGDIPEFNPPPAANTRVVARADIDPCPPYRGPISIEPEAISEPSKAIREPRISKPKASKPVKRKPSARVQDLFREARAQAMGCLLRTHREVLGLSLQRVSTLTGISASALALYELGRSEVTNQTHRKRIAIAYHVPLSIWSVVAKAVERT
jgi:hypothetical protein